MTVYEAISLMLAFGLIIIAILFSKKGNRPPRQR
ncbi:putative holin-like toxin [Paenibacillus sp. 32O-W]